MLFSVFCRSIERDTLRVLYVMYASRGGILAEMKAFSCGLLRIPICASRSPCQLGATVPGSPLRVAQAILHLFFPATLPPQPTNNNRTKESCPGRSLASLPFVTRQIRPPCT